MNKPINAHIWNRSENEWYQEPAWVTKALLRVEDFRTGIWDSACGGGNIVAAAIDSGIEACGTDIVRRCDPSADWFVCEKDFLRAIDMLSYNIITNPPYGRAKLAEAFIRKALSLKPEKFAVFVEARFLAGQGRAAGLFTEHPPSRVWMITPRPSCPPGAYLTAGNKPEGGKQDYCWIVYERCRSLNTQLRWLDCTAERGK